MTDTLPSGGPPAAAPPSELLAGPVVTPSALLDAREARVDRRRGLQRHHPGAVVIGITLVVPGPVKTSRRLEALRDEAVQAVAAACADQAWPVLRTDVVDAVTGPEALLAVEAPADGVKRATTGLEDTHPVGRLWDLDVHDGDHGYSRVELGLAPRTCLVCDAPGHACARARAHTLADTTHAMEVLDGRRR